MKSLAEHNIEVYRPKGLGGWRALYLRLLDQLEVRSVAEFGCGTPDFLAALPSDVRGVGLDGGDRYAPDFARLGIEFHVVVLDRDRLPDFGRVQVGVCSDVFEHLVHPERTLELISDALADDGFLISHVPNEFTLRRILAIMMGRRDAVHFHTDSEEWDDPHLRRFTDIGFRRFLDRRFAYNLKLTDLRLSREAQWLKRIGIRPPFCLEYGPTYASTHDERTHRALIEAKRRLA